MSEIKFKCKYCNAEIGAPPGTNGKLANCPKCGKELRIPNESTPGIKDASTEMVGLLVGVGFQPNASEFEILLENGELIPGLQYVTIELTKQEAGDEKYLTNMFRSAAVKQGWLQGVHTKLTIKKAKVKGKPVVIVYPSLASQTVGEAAKTGSANIRSEAKKEVRARKWWQFWK